MEQHAFDPVLAGVVEHVAHEQRGEPAAGPLRLGVDVCDERFAPLRDTGLRRSGEHGSESVARRMWTEVSGD